MLTFIKLGGSIITDKRGQEAADLPTIGRLAREIASGWKANPGALLLIGHGSGSFGHVYAARYGIHRGLPPHANWSGYALTARAALRLNRIVVDALLAAGLPALALQPSASLQSAGGIIQTWAIETIERALQHNLVPVIHGDVAFDTEKGSAIISTEALFTYLALQTPIQPTRMIMVGATAIYTADPFLDPDARRIPLITQANIDEALRCARGSRGVDVTGGMYNKLKQLWELVQMLPKLEIYVVGADPGLITRIMQGTAIGEGTRICHH